MRKTVMTLAGLGLILPLAACTDSTGGDEGTEGAAAEETTDAAPASAEAEACEEFFGGQVPLADRAEQDRTALTGGEVTDEVAYAEINGLESRIGSLADSAPEEIASLLEQVNTPFTEAVERVNAFEPEEDGPTMPDLQDIEVAQSADAQSELESVCDSV